MEINWLGHSCFRISGSRIKIITDPFPPNLGYSLGSPTAQIATVSHPHPSHSYLEGVAGQFKRISGPGEYEIGGVLITGLASFHDAEQGKTRGRNTIYLIEIDDVVVCHLGDLGHSLPAAQVEEMGNVDVLLLPVGGGSTINAAAAAAVVRQLEPKVVIPMHYKTPVLTRELDPVDKFLNEIGVKQLEPQPKLALTKSNLPQAMQVYLLSY